jgi:hypothetical protein
MLLNPTSVDLVLGANIDFEALVFDANQNGGLTENVTWTASTGAIDSSGVYTATTTGGPFTIIGIYQGTTSGGGVLQATATVKVFANPILPDYSDWIGNYPGTDLFDPDADYDGDGKSNEWERCFGTDPTDSASTSPYAVLSNISGGSFAYTRRDSALNGMTYSIWTSTSLGAGSWSEDTGAIQTASEPDSQGVETVSVVLSEDLLGNPKLFIQIRAD